MHCLIFAAPLRGVSASIRLILRAIPMPTVMGSLPPRCGGRCRTDFTDSERGGWSVGPVAFLPS